MAARSNRLTTRTVQSIGKPGRYADGNGLYLHVAAGGARSWVYRYMLHGRSREMGLGGVDAVPLAEARRKAQDARRLCAEGRDPLDARRAAKNAARLADASTFTFKDAADAYITAHGSAWRNAKHAAQWKSTLTLHVYPTIGDLPVAGVDTDGVLGCLEPIWHRTPETASRVRGRIESVLDWARVRGYRDGPNPAVWRGHLALLLPARTKVQKVQHQPALPYSRMPEFMTALKELVGTGALALEFQILTAARTGEVLGMTWAEVDLETQVWMRPAERMKGGRAHRVPLVPRAIEILGQMPTPQGKGKLVFAGLKPGKPLSDMTLNAVIRRMNTPTPTWVDPTQSRRPIVPHGFRSSFRDWVAETTTYSRELAEAALAHTEGDKVVAAYQRGDMFEKRWEMMLAWACHCAPWQSTGSAGSNA